MCIFNLKITPMTIQQNFIKLTLTAFVAFAAITAFSQPLSSPVRDITYTLNNQYDGTNASAVVWVPKSQMYVTVVAGNAQFPLEGFSSSGTNIFSEAAGVDARGMWYNTKSGELEINAAGEMGWYTFSIANSNRPTARLNVFSGQYQPDFQSIGVYDEAKKQVCFLNADANGIVCYSRKKPSKTKSFSLNFTSTSSVNLNPYAFGYTGQAGFEFVCMDYVNRNMVFFDRSGNQTASVAIPQEAPANDWFAFSYANGRAFFYDKENRIWTGYKVF